MKLLFWERSVGLDKYIEKIAVIQYAIYHTEYEITNVHCTDILDILSNDRRLLQSMLQLSHNRKTLPEKSFIIKCQVEKSPESVIRYQKSSGIIKV